jgi:BirA family transcriptional regulator, biotin operon repressor / biotin---[acetyl-CoA-carboxylase] ligase
VEGAAYDGHSSEALASLLGLPSVAAYASVASTMDEAHALAESGAAAGTLVLADAQSQGRGRGGRPWTSLPGSGIWLTLVERPSDAAAIGVLSLRLGLRAARVLDRFAGESVRLKWPNDLMLRDRKLAGILVEARWRDRRPEWAAIGFGLNLTAPPGVSGAASLGVGTSRLAVLAELVPALRAGASARGLLDARELASFAERDWARGRIARSPRAGRVSGVSADGALLLETESGIEAVSSGSLVLDGEDE